MTGPEHFREAEAVLRKAQETKDSMYREGDWSPLESAAALQVLYAEAQVHATLALAAATAANIRRNGAVSSQVDGWTALLDRKPAGE